MSNGISEQMVRERAQAIWQREGCPDGDADRHWAMAETELQAEAAESSAKPKARAKKAAAEKPANNPDTAPKPKATRAKRQPAAKSTS
jgi:hypothetical protein